MKEIFIEENAMYACRDDEYREAWYFNLFGV